MSMKRRRTVVRPIDPVSSASSILIGTPAKALTRQWRVWLLTAAAVAVVGVFASVGGARALANTDADKSHADFVRASSEVTAALQLAIQHDDDLVLNASGYIVAHPDATQSEFTTWSDTVHILDRYPEVLGVGFAVIVPATELQSFAERVTAESSGRVAAAGGFVVSPPGDRPYYCLSRLVTLRMASVAPPGHDWCASSEYGATNLAARDSGESLYTPVDAGGGVRLLSINVPVYRSGDEPVSVLQRRKEFLGWVGTAMLPKLVLDRALLGHPDMAVEMTYRSGASTASFSSGSISRGSQRSVVDLGDGWTITTFGTPVTAGLFHETNALMALLGGCTLSLLIGVLVYVMGTSRARAFRLVDDRTAELRHQALHDALTGLPNRSLIMDRIGQLLARARRLGTVGCALYVDLDDFKNVNDTLGHETGDLLLIAVAHRFATVLSDADTIGRMGGDEFVVLIESAEGVMGPQQVALRLLDAMIEPFELPAARKPLTVHASIGIAVGDRLSGGDLLRDADTALYRAKGKGKNRFETFYTKMHTDISRRVDIEQQLRSAVQNGQLCVHYQPIYRLDDLSIVTVEALLRWEHPELGNITPDEFIPILESSDQIQTVGRWVLDEACAQVAAWRAAGDTLNLSVNVSARQLDDDRIVADIRSALDRSGLASTALTIEVTETALMLDTADTALRLRAIKALGVRVAVDDFGAGYSSLAYLQQFPVDCLKIDRRFVTGVTQSNESKALIRTFVQLGRDLRLCVLAEGVETHEELRYLRSEHVDEAQGFLFSRPLDPASLERLLLVPTRPTTQHRIPVTGSPRSGSG